SLVKAGKKNLIVARTFSKIYALAGLRIGYGLAAPETIARLDTWASIDNTNLPAAIAANASLQDAAFIRRSLDTTAESRKIVTRALDELKLAYLPSHANFIFHRVNSSSAAYRDSMKKLHIMVGRPFDHTDGWNRLTLGTPAEMQAFVKALKTLRQQGLA
ncbi:MAG: aminotransferase class I/II-fold pyridoxal phosphate-dependent enzyme, partial [Paracoccaceae bacterium]